MMGFLALATLVFVVFTRTHLELTNAEAYALLVLYALFLGWMLLETVGVVDGVQGL
jgi:cation:H+ antiporter